MTVAGKVLCSECRISSATRLVTMPAGGELLRCQWCADKLAAQGATVTALPGRAPQHTQTSLPTIGDQPREAGPTPAPPSVRARAGGGRKWPHTAAPSQPSSASAS